MKKKKGKVEEIQKKCQLREAYRLDLLLSWLQW